MTAAPKVIRTPPPSLAALAEVAAVSSTVSLKDDAKTDDDPPAKAAPPMPKLSKSALHLDPVSQYTMSQLLASTSLAASGHLTVRPQFLHKPSPPSLQSAGGSVPMAFYHHNPQLMSQFQQQHPFVPPHFGMGGMAPVPFPLPFSQHPIVKHGGEIWAQMKAQQQKLQEEQERRQKNAAADSMLTDDATAAGGGTEFDMPPLPPLPGTETKMPALSGQEGLEIEMPPLPGQELPSLTGQGLPGPGLYHPGQPFVYHPAESLDQYHGRAPGSSAAGGAGPGMTAASAATAVGGNGTSTAAAAPDKPKKRGRGRPKGSKNKPKPPGWVKPSKRKDANKPKSKAAKATKTTKATPVVKPAIQAADVNVASLEAGGRKCQQRFTTSGEELHFTSMKDGRVALTTNTPREVEEVDPKTNVRVHLFNSCSDAARLTSINRTKLSRTCRKGGGILERNSHGTLLYRYTENPAPGTSTGDASDFDSDYDDDATTTIGDAVGGDGEDQDTAALAAAAVAAAVAAGDATAYAEAVKAQRKEESNSFSV